MTAPVMFSPNGSSTFMAWSLSSGSMKNPPIRPSAFVGLETTQHPVDFLTCDVVTE